MGYLIKSFITLYQKFFSPVLHALGGPGCGCRFSPTCSQYCIEAIDEYGVIKGVYLGVLRIVRCNPWGGMGLDPVPSRCKEERGEFSN